MIDINDILLFYIKLVNFFLLYSYLIYFFLIVEYFCGIK